MLGSLKNLISSLVEDARLQKFDDTDCRLATAALLTRVATVDSEMSEARRGKLHAVLKSSFGLDDLTTVQLIMTLPQPTEVRLTLPFHPPAQSCSRQ